MKNVKILMLSENVFLCQGTWHQLIFLGTTVQNHLGAFTKDARKRRKIHFHPFCILICTHVPFLSFNLRARVLFRKSGTTLFLPLKKMRTEYEYYSILEVLIFCDVFYETYNCDSIWKFFQLSSRIAFFYLIHSYLKAKNEKNWQWKAPIFWKLLPFKILYHQFSQFHGNISVTIIHLF